MIDIVGRIITPLMLAGISLGSSAFARDLEMLTRLLIPAYIAQNFAGLCLDQNAQFLSSPNNETAMVSVFAEHVKREITIGLPDSEAANVRIMAADAARDVARYEMRVLGGRPSGVAVDALNRWCDRSAKFFILEIMRKHQERHDEFDKLVEAAKR